jgi:hypothetical protein
MPGGVEAPRIFGIVAGGLNREVLDLATGDRLRSVINPSEANRPFAL